MASTVDSIASPLPLLGVTRSARGQIWTARCTDMPKAKLIAQAAGVTDFVGELLCGRDIEPSEAEKFLAPTLRNSMPDPSSFADMDKAAGLILDSVVAEQSITVFADYDVDGGTSAAQLIRWARHMGVELDLYVPDRVAEGYGPSVEAFESIKASGAELVITVDCGAAAHDALSAAADLDLPIVVLDHHLMDGAMPPAAAIVNPNRPDDESGQGHLAAAGVTFMMLAALNREAKRRGLTDVPDIRKFLDLAAMGTICDVVSLTGVNRAIVSQGLRVLGQGLNLGLTALADVSRAKAPLGTYHAGFLIGPRINAGGRIGRADMGAQLLSTDDPAIAHAYAERLDEVNHERKAMQDDMLTEALTRAAKLPEDHSVTIVSMEGWHPGVIGIVAGRLKERYNRPAIVIGVNDEDIGKGSGRSIKGVNLGGAIAKAKAAGLLSSGGGHEMAGGLTIAASKIAVFSAFMNAELAADVGLARANTALKIDAVLTPGGVNAVTMDDIDRVGPYGAGNPQPVFAFADMRIAYAERVRGGHVRCAFEDAGGARISAIAFRADENGIADLLLSAKSPIVHVAGRLKRDSWNGRERIDLQVQDLAISSH